MPTDLPSGLHKTMLMSFGIPTATKPMLVGWYKHPLSVHSTENMGWLNKISGRQKKTSFKYRTIQSFLLGKQQAWEDIKIYYCGTDNLHPCFCFPQILYQSEVSSVGLQDREQGSVPWGAIGDKKSCGNPLLGPPAHRVLFDPYWFYLI